MTYAILATILMIVLLIRLWRQGGLVSMLLAVAFGVTIGMAGGSVGNVAEWFISTATSVADWVSTGFGGGNSE